MSVKLPRLLKEPTGWVILIFVAGFFYVQWPTKVRVPEEPEYYAQTLDNGFSVRWEAQPDLQSEANPQAWGMTRKGMSFLVQVDTLNQPFDALVMAVAEQDKNAVGGAVQEPMALTDKAATYAFFDADSRIQRHQWYQIGDQWVKVSVLYKPSMESRVKRAEAFLDSIRLPD
jgi:hypothetical protein